MTYRTTTKYVELDGDVLTRFTREGPRGEQTWVPTRIIEELRETDESASQPVSYAVKVHGSVLKKDGTMGGNTASRSYHDHAPSGNRINDIPSELSALLQGEAGLRTWRLA